MKITIKASNKEQKKDIHKGVIRAIKHQFSLCSVSDMLYHGSKWSQTKGDKNKGTDFQGCSIKIDDTYTDTHYKDKIKERKGEQNE